MNTAELGSPHRRLWIACKGKLGYWEGKIEYSVSSEIATHINQLPGAEIDTILDDKERFDLFCIEMRLLYGS